MSRQVPDNKKPSKLEEKIQKKEYNKDFEKKQKLFGDLMARELTHKKELIDTGAFDKTGYALEGCERCKTKYCYALKGKMGMMPDEKPCEDCLKMMELANFLSTGIIHLFNKETILEK